MKTTSGIPSTACFFVKEKQLVPLSRSPQSSQPHDNETQINPPKAFRHHIANPTVKCLSKNQNHNNNAKNNHNPTTLQPYKIFYVWRFGPVALRYKTDFSTVRIIVLGVGGMA